MGEAAAADWRPPLTGFKDGDEAAAAGVRVEDAIGELAEGIIY